MVNNQALKFLLPLISEKLNPNLLLKDELIGVFVGDVHNSSKDGDLLLAYKYPRTLKWSDFESILKEIPEYSGDYDYGDKGYVVYSFSMDDYEEDYSHFISGEYSKLSPESKLKIIKFWDRHSNSSLPKKILEVDEELISNWQRWKKNPKDYCQEGELWYRPELNDEIFNKDKEY